MCIVIPVGVALFTWWMPDMARRFCGKCQCEQESDIRKNNNQKQIISKEDIEHLLTAAAVMGIKKIISKYPKTTETVDEVLKTFIKPDGKKNKKLTK